MKRTKKTRKKPATRAYKTLRAMPEPAPLTQEESDKKALGFVVAGLFKLAEDNPWLLAAAVAWIRTRWRGEAEVLTGPVARGEALLWIEDRAKEMRTRAMGEAVAGVLRAAVTA